jgi:hypothetical protein
MPRAKAMWSPHDNNTHGGRSPVLELTTLDEDIAMDTALTITVANVSTPECASPAGEILVTTYEKEIVRNTIPPSIRGGHIVDGPTKMPIPTLLPGKS